MKPHDIQCAIRLREAGAPWSEIGRALHFPENTVWRTLHCELAMREYTQWYLSTAREADLRCAVHMVTNGAGIHEVTHALCPYPTTPAA